MDVLGLDEDLLCGDTMLPSVNVEFNELQEDFGGDQALSLPLKSIYSTAKSSPLPSPGVWGVLSIEAASRNCGQHFAQAMGSKSTSSAEVIRLMSANKFFAAAKKPEPV